ncbi:MAG: RlmE family RNA methyltransferase [Desulfobacterales bacterium]
MPKRGPTPNQWADHYTRQAKKDNFAARSVYKLQEIQRRCRVIRRGARVLDLGCAPGSWLQYAAQLTGSGGKVVGIDLKPVSVSLPSHVSVVTGDILARPSPLQALSQEVFDVVTSDMAPATTGNRATDAARSAVLCEAALAVARRVLAPGGNFVCKIFQGQDFKPFAEAVKSAFTQLKVIKPQSSRKASKEIFIIGIGKKQEDLCPDIANGQP